MKGMRGPYGTLSRNAAQIVSLSLNILMYIRQKINRLYGINCISMKANTCDSLI